MSYRVKKTHQVKNMTVENIEDVCSSWLGLFGVTAELGHHEVWTSAVDVAQD